MAITSRMDSTTQIISCFRMELAHMEQMSASATLRQRWQNLISLLMRVITSLKFFTNDSSCFNICSTSRNAVFFPIPGNLENSFTAFSRREEENCIWRRYAVTYKEQGKRKVELMKSEEPGFSEKARMKSRKRSVARP